MSGAGVAGARTCRYGLGGGGGCSWLSSCIDGGPQILMISPNTGMPVHPMASGPQVDILCSVLLQPVDSLLVSLRLRQLLLKLRDPAEQGGGLVHRAQLVICQIVSVIDAHKGFRNPPRVLELRVSHG